MAGWEARVEALLYNGETVSSGHELGTSSIVVTSHRVLAFTPDSEGANFRYVDRPNVDGVTVTSGGDDAHLRTALRAVAYGVAFLLAGWFLPLDSVLSNVAMPSSTGRLGLGGIAGLLQTLLGLLRNLDDLLVSFGALALLFSCVPMGVYLWSRERALVIEVAGEEDIVVPTDDEDADRLADELWGTLAPATAQESNTPE